MKILLQCVECGHEEVGTDTGTLMNKIKMWNHLKKDHPMLAERMMARHDMLPSSFYREVGSGAASREPMHDIRPRWA